MSKLKNDSEQYRKYLSGELSSEEVHAFERSVLKDPFEQEALDGLERFDSEIIASDLKQLTSAINQKKKRGFSWMRIAAAVALIAVSSLSIWLITKPLDSDQALAIEESVEKSDIEKEEVDEGAPELNEEVVQEIGSGTQAATLQPEPSLSESNEVAAAEENEIQTTAEVSIEPPAPVATSIAVEEVQLAELDTEDSVNDSFVALQGRAAGVQVASGDFADDEVAFAPIVLDTGLSAYENRDALQNAIVQQESAKKLARASSSGRSFTNITKSISGKITDENGERLPGVNVVVKESTTGTTTDLDGNYQLEVPEGSTLAVSFIGFGNQEVEVGDENIVNIELSNDATELSEVVVTGYGIEDDDNSPSYKPAQPEDGLRTFKKYLEDNLRYPEAAITNKIEGTVVLEVVVSANGEISNTRVRRSLGYGCDLEAIRLVEKGPNWISATKGDGNVEDTVRVRVRFKLK